MQNSPTCVREVFTAKTQIGPQLTDTGEASKPRACNGRRDRDTKKNMSPPHPPNSFQRKNLQAPHQQKTAAKTKKCHDVVRLRKKRLRSRSPTFFSNPALPPPPAPWGDRACVHANKSGTCRHAHACNYKTLAARLALRAPTCASGPRRVPRCARWAGSRIPRLQLLSEPTNF